MQLRKLCGSLALMLALACTQAFAAEAPKADSKEAPKSEAPKVGTPLPALDGFSLEGKLPDTKGKVVIVDFWASWCGPCVKSLPAFKELHEKYAGQGLVIIAVSLDEEKDAMDAFLKKTPVPFAVVRDAEEKLQKRFDISGIPQTYIVDRQGVIRLVHDGYAGDETKKEYVTQVEALLK